MAELWDPQVGDVVCDCNYRHQKIIERDGDDLTLEGGFKCSLQHCCDDPRNCTHPGAPLRVVVYRCPQCGRVSLSSEVCIGGRMAPDRGADHGAVRLVPVLMQEVSSDG